MPHCAPPVWRSLPGQLAGQAHTSLPGPVRRAHLPRAEHRSVASCWSTRWFLRPAIEPERPGLYRASPEHRPAGAHGSAARRALISFSSAASTACRVCSPSPTGPPTMIKPSSTSPSMNAACPAQPCWSRNLTRGVPLWAVDQPHGEIGHARSVRAATDIQADPSITPAVLTATGSFGCEAGALVADPASKPASVRAASVRG